MAKSVSSRAVTPSTAGSLQKHEQQELEATLWRFGQLTARAQLQAYEFIRGYLAEKVKETDADRQVAEQKEALEVIRQVAADLGLPEGKAPTATQFDEASKRLNLGWSVSRAGRAWGGKWRFACQAFIGARVHPSSRQKALLDVGTGKRRQYENYRTAIQLWLETHPPSESVAAYDAWAREFNDALPEGQPPVPGWTAMYQGVRVSLADLVRVARGETLLEDCVRKVRDHRGDRGPLVAQAWIAGEHQLSHDAARKLLYKPYFPKPVCNLSGTRAWLKEDVEAYFVGRAFPERGEYELQNEFLSLAELAALMGRKPRVLVAQGAFRPAEAGLVSRKRYWRRDEVELWLRESRTTPDP